MSKNAQSLYPIFIKWMSFHFPILTLLYLITLMKLLNYFGVIQIRFLSDDFNEDLEQIANIICLALVYVLIMILLLRYYIKVLQIKMSKLNLSETKTIKQYEEEVKKNTQEQLMKLEKNEKYIKWKQNQQELQEQMLLNKTKRFYQMVEQSSSSSQEQVQTLSQHRLATSKKIF